MKILNWRAVALETNVPYPCHPPPQSQTHHLRYEYFDEFCSHSNGMMCSHRHCQSWMLNVMKTTSKPIPWFCLCLPDNSSILSLDSSGRTQTVVASNCWTCVRPIAMGASHHLPASAHRPLPAAPTTPPASPGTLTTADAGKSQRYHHWGPGLSRPQLTLVIYRLLRSRLLSGNAEDSHRR